MKKVLALVLSLVLMASLLAACGGDSSSAGSTSTPAGGSTSTPAPSTGGNTDASGNVTIMTWDSSDVPGMELVIKAFNQVYPNISVKIESIPWTDYWTKLLAAAQGGDMPDIFQMHFARFEKFIFGDALLPLDDVLPADLWGEYPATLVDPYVVDGQHMGVPTELFMNLLYYNKEIFDANNMAYPDETWDWDQLVQASIDLTDADQNIYGFGARNHTTEGYDSFIYQNGGTVLTDDRKSGFDQEATQEAIQWWADFSLVHKSSPTMEQFAETDLIQRFTSGGMAMAVLDSWRIAPFDDNPDIAGKYGVAVLPHGKEEAALFSAPAWVIPKAAPNQEAAAIFLNWFTTEEGQNLYSENVRLSARNGCQQVFYDKHTDLASLEDVVNKTIAIGVPVPSTKDKDDWSTYEAEVMAKILAGQVSVKDGCNDIAAYMNQVIENEY